MIVSKTIPSPVPGNAKAITLSGDVHHLTVDVPI
jgi:hypothetical protein